MLDEVMPDPKRRRGLMLVLSSPSGAGKTTLSRQLLENDSQIQLSVSCTTRAKRSGERDGVDPRGQEAVVHEPLQVQPVQAPQRAGAVSLGALAAP